MKHIFLIIFLLIGTVELTNARSRFGRSFGRRGGRSLFGASRTRTNRVKMNPRRQATRSARPNTLGGLNSRGRSSGGFMRSMGGAIAGTMIGSMIFRAFGMNPGMYAGGGGGGGGMGFLFPILILGFGFLWFKSRYKKPAYNGGRNFYNDYNEYETVEQTGHCEDLDPDDLQLNNQDDFLSERNKDFFSIQHAWSKQNLESVKTKMTPEIFDEFSKEIAEMREKRETSVLENLMINKSTTLESWDENGKSFATLNFKASLIEYIKDDKEVILQGSKTDYTDLEEAWTFSKQQGETWKLSAIENNQTTLS